MGLKPVEGTSNFSGAHMGQSLRLSSKCDYHFLNNILHADGYEQNAHVPNQNHCRGISCRLQIDLEMSASVKASLSVLG